MRYQRWQYCVQPVDQQTTSTTTAAKSDDRCRRMFRGKLDGMDVILDYNTVMGATLDVSVVVVVVDSVVAE